MPKRENWATYSENYKRIVFQTWYSNGRPAMPKLRDLIPVDDQNRKPSLPLLKDWRIRGDWETRADEMDAKALVLSDDYLVQQKTQMLVRQANTGFVLQQLGLAYLISGGFDSSSAAVNAVIRGAELERSSRGIGEALRKMADMSDDDLQKEIMERIKRASDSGEMILDAEQIDDTESTDE